MRPCASMYACLCKCHGSANAPDLTTGLFTCQKILSFVRCFNTYYAHDAVCRGWVPCGQECAGSPGTCGCGYGRILPLLQQPEPLLESWYVSGLLKAESLGGSVHLSHVAAVIKMHHNNLNHRVSSTDQVRPISLLCADNEWMQCCRDATW